MRRGGKEIAPPSHVHRTRARGRDEGPIRCSHLRSKGVSGLPIREEPNQRGKKNNHCIPGEKVTGEKRLRSRLVSLNSGQSREDGLDETLPRKAHRRRAIPRRATGLCRQWCLPLDRFKSLIVGIRRSDGERKFCNNIGKRVHRRGGIFSLPKTHHLLSSVEISRSNPLIAQR